MILLRRTSLTLLGATEDSGFTLIELLVAFAFVAVAMVSILAVVRSSLRLVNTSRGLAVAAQAAMAPDLRIKELGVRAREVRSDPVELGPLRFQSVLLEMVPPGETYGLRVRVYK